MKQKAAAKSENKKTRKSFGFLSTAKRKERSTAKRTRIMLISLMISEMFHLLSARLFSVVFIFERGGGKGG